MIIREINEQDALALGNLIRQVENESEFMLMEPGERKIDVEQQKKWIKSMQNQENSTIIVAEKDNHLLGYLLVIGGSAKRNQHSAYIVIGILKKYRGQGNGKKLFAYLDKWATEHKIHRLELTVVKDNESGVKLYKRMGFKIEGLKKHSLFIEGRFRDEYYMAKLL
ncbi:GNAT family N-acetyltransferase [Mesobacillus maritimus]|uniref:GNAT family N-acetyltransferase n=1 Tax=Mesobacillus maritimus TaxID=1643336 RepID=UPI00203C900B|nr:GNAT family N-acetyltransferase [Mesobacillus maritimus]MCM3586717.1 GNAT family N-acetyltransferase [Mesobacillus maritimus]MCM3668529.1 GNAT family N-acetyltransferase [Mesobacillus maritimus]